MKIDISSTLLQAAERCMADYKAALAKGDLENAMANAQKCIFIYGKLAERAPYHPQSFHLKAKEWKEIVSSLKEQALDKNRQQIQNKPPVPEPLKGDAEKKSGQEIPDKTPVSEPLKAEEEKKIIPDAQGINEQFWRDTIPAPSDIQVPVMDAVFHIALEIAKEGREGRQVGTAFLIGDADAVLKLSKQLILNPFQGHKDEDRSITNPEMKECIKELAQLDGAFIIRGNGIVEAAARYITMDTSKVIIPPGHGTRHSSIAAVTQETKSIGIIVSQSGGKISFIKEGKIFKTIHP